MRRREKWSQPVGVLLRQLDKAQARGHGWSSKTMFTKIISGQIWPLDLYLLPLL